MKFTRPQKNHETNFPLGTSSLNKAPTIPNFNKGSLLALSLFSYRKKEHDITGICLKKKNKGFDSSFTLKYTLNSTNEPIIQTFVLHSPFIRQISVSKY